MLAHVVGIVEGVAKEKPPSAPRCMEYIEKYGVLPDTSCCQRTRPAAYPIIEQRAFYWSPQ